MAPPQGTNSGTHWCENREKKTPASGPLENVDCVLPMCNNRYYYWDLIRKQRQTLFKSQNIASIRPLCRSSGDFDDDDDGDRVSRSAAIGRVPLVGALWDKPAATNGSGEDQVNY